MFNTLYRTLLMMWRMLKSACLRPFRSMYAHFRRATNLTRQASRLIPKAVKSITTVKVKPQSRKDYVDAGPVYIAKSLIVVVIAAIIAIWLLGQFVVWPWMESKWFTAKIFVQEDRVETYTGKVKLYSDEEKTQLIFRGRLEDGKKTGKGTEYHENGVESFIGVFEQGAYTGEGKLQDENGNVIYEGGFAQGLYDGTGKLYCDAQLVYEGQFVQGERSGQGKTYENGALAYEGSFAQGLYEGAGKTYYANGQVKMECLTFTAGLADGNVIEYHENGQKKYEGTMARGVKEGMGTLYDEAGNKLYTGSFAADQYEGEGTEFHAGGKKKYVGAFAEGLYEGAGVLYRQDGSVLYEGAFAAGLYEGEGTLSLESGLSVKGTFRSGKPEGEAQYLMGDQPLYEGVLEDDNAQGAGVLYANGKSIYTGAFIDGFIDAQSMLDLPVSEVRESIFAGAELSETQAERGFVIKNEGLQAAVFCNYGYNDAEIVVHRVYLYGEGLDSWFGGDAFAVPEGYTKAEKKNEIPLLIPGVKATLQTSHACTRYVYDTHTLRIWTDANGQTDLIEWRSWTDLAAEGGANEDTEGAMVEGLLTALGFDQEAEE